METADQAEHEIEGDIEVRISFSPDIPQLTFCQQAMDIESSVAVYEQAAGPSSTLPVRPEPTALPSTRSGRTRTFLGTSPKAA